MKLHKLSFHLLPVTYKENKTKWNIDFKKEHLVLVWLSRPHRELKEGHIYLLEADGDLD